MKIVNKFFHLICWLIKCPLKKGINVDVHSRLSRETLLKVEGLGKINIGYGFHTRGRVRIHCLNEGKIEINNNVFINDNCIITALKEVVIGEGTTIGPNTVIYDHDHDICKHEGFVSKSIKIGNNVWIGAGCIILKGVTIGENSVIAAGTIVTKDVPSNTLIRNELHIIQTNILKPDAVELSN